MKRYLIFLSVCFSFFSCYGMSLRDDEDSKLEIKQKEVGKKQEQLKKLDDDFCDKFLRIKKLLKQFEREKAAREEKKKKRN